MNIAESIKNKSRMLKIAHYLEIFQISAKINQIKTCSRKIITIVFLILLNKNHNCSKLAKIIHKCNKVKEIIKLA